MHSLIGMYGPEIVLVGEVGGDSWDSYWNTKKVIYNVLILKLLKRIYKKLMRDVSLMWYLITLLFLVLSVSF